MKFNNIALKITILFMLSLSYLESSDLTKIIKLKKPFFISNLQLTDYKEKKIYLKEKKSDYFLLNFWASWCAPCVKEMKSLNNLQKKNAKITVITVSQDASLNKAEEFFDRNQYKYLEKYYDFDKSVLKNFSVRGLPTTFIANSDYKVFAKVEGIIEWDSKGFSKWLYKN